MLNVSGVSVQYGETVALDRVDLTVNRGEIVAVLGPSGSGKTSLLRAIAGLEPATTGDIVWDDDPVTHLPAHRRGFGLMFQDHALFSHHDVIGNVEFGLRMRDGGQTKSERQTRARAVLDLVGMAGYDHRRVDQLSGGEQQRVALARALAPSPRLLMLDEPLASVDRERREHLAAELHRIIRAAGTPTLLVTHDLDEAFTLADTVVVLDGGHVLQRGPAADVWRAPNSIVVARFLEVTAELRLQVVDGFATTPWGPVSAPGATTVWIGFRAADLRIDPDGPVRGTVRAAWFRRDHYLLELDTADGPMTVTSSRPVAVGACVQVRADLDAAVILDA